VISLAFDDITGEPWIVSAFDREYMRQQTKVHDKAVELFQKEADRGKNQELKAWASKTLPTLRELHQTARQIASDKSSGSSNKSGNSSGRNNGQPGRPCPSGF
jgi:hypothetical protein